MGATLSALPGWAFEAAGALPGGVFREQWAGRVVGGRYLVGAALGRGGQAAVFEGRSLIDDAPVAIKVFEGRTPTQSAWREALSAVAVDHPRLVRSIDAGRDARAAWVVSELYRGRTLRREVALAPLSSRARWTLCRELLEGLTAAWACRLAHGDVSPRNVIVGRDGAKLIDLGLSGLRGEARSACGTLGYAAPELVEGGALGPATDMFGLGATLWFASTGRPPFPARTWRGYLEAVAARRLDAAGLVDDGRWLNLLVWMLDPSPARRPDAAAVEREVDAAGG